MTTTIVWYFTEPGATPLPYYTVFGSGNWSNARDEWDGPGEVLGSRRAWRDGSPPVNLAGANIVGSPDDFQNGVSIDDADYHTVNASVLPPPLWPGVDFFNVVGFVRQKAARAYKATFIVSNPINLPPGFADLQPTLILNGDDITPTWGYDDGDLSISLSAADDVFLLVRVHWFIRSRPDLCDWLGVAPACDTYFHSQFTIGTEFAPGPGPTCFYPFVDGVEFTPAG